MTLVPRRARVRWAHAHRVINSRYPPIDVFERVDRTLTTASVRMPFEIK